MKFSELFIQLRSQHGLTQEEAAHKLLVSRQAVSRWERGETLPSVDTLLLISKAFQVSIGALLGEPLCQSCGMPLHDNSLFSHEADGTANLDYCKWCYADGGFAMDCTMQEMIDCCLPHMTGPAMTEQQARDWMTHLLPELKRWRQE